MKRQLLAFLLLLCVADAAQAERVQVYRKEDGTLLFTNRPPATVREPGMRLLETRVYGDDHYEHKPARLTAKRRDAYDDVIARASSRWRVEFALVKAVVHAESAFDPDAVSKAGARGLMQLMPSTARLLSVENLHDPEQNINGGARYLRMMLDRFRGNVRNALAAYNAGPANVQKYGGIPPFSETKMYVSRVSELADEYRDLVVAKR